MKISLPHRGTEAEGIAQIKKMLEEHRQKIAENATEVKTDWQDNVMTFGFTAQGSHIEGTVTVVDKEFQVYAKLPLALRLFEGTIERMVSAEIQKLKL